VTLLARIGGNEPAKNTYNILRHVISQTFALSIRMTDTTGKIAFGKLRLAVAIRGTVYVSRNCKAHMKSNII
jgi:hypothetical protein